MKQSIENSLTFAYLPVDKKSSNTHCASQNYRNHASDNKNAKLPFELVFSVAVIRYPHVAVQIFFVWPDGHLC